MKKRGRYNTIVPRLSDRAERTASESFGGGGGDDWEHLHTKAGRVSLTGSHCTRIEQYRAPRTLQRIGGRDGRDRYHDVELDVVVVNDVK